MALLRLSGIADVRHIRIASITMRSQCQTFRWVLLLAVFMQPVVACAETPELMVPQPGRFVITTAAGGFSRTAQVHIPAGDKRQAPLPLVLVLHGAGGNGRVVLDHDRWAASAEQHNFLVVAPDGLPAIPGRAAAFRNNPSLWNSGQLNSRSPRAAIDDVAYIRLLLDDLRVRLPYDERRVYCCGHSNGGAMTFRLAAELSVKFAAIGTVAGCPASADLKPKQPMSTLCIFGTKDPLVPMEGGDVQLPWGVRHSPPVLESVSRWAKFLGCETDPTAISNSEGVEKLQYLSQSKGPTLTVLLVEGHGHQWPGSKSFLPELLVGPVTAKVDATELLWEFFSSKSLPEAK